METEFDYDKIGLKIGIEIHQQLDSATKLFCHCPNMLQGTRKPDFSLLRQQRPVLGEEGEFDKGMLVEFLKKGQTIYEGYYDSTCTYELDETPPFDLNQEALEISLQICALLNTDVIRELHICRKNYVDGSVPAGFQRTMEIGKDGFITLANGKKIGIENVFLEEDAARRIKTEGKVSYFRVDRLGIPLNEVTTSPDISSPLEAREAAYRIGLLLDPRIALNGSRYTRQDINISIKGGERIEIKGVQKLDWIPELVKFEIQRQQGLISIKEQLASLSITPENIKNTPKDLSSLFKNTDCRFVKTGISKGQKLVGLKIPKMKGIFGLELYPNIRFGTEIAKKVAVLTGLQGIIHSDENLVEKYHFSLEEIKAAQKKLKCTDQDLFLFILGKPEPIEIAMDIIISRIIMAFEGVPEETRQAKEDGTHIFLRELGGEKRLYPDTDTPSILISNTQIDYAYQNRGEYPWDVIKKLGNQYKVKETQIEELIMRGKLPLFQKTITIIPDNPTLVLFTIIDTVTVLRRDEKNTGALNENHFIELLTGIKEKVVTREAIEPILAIWTENPNLSLIEAKNQVGIMDFDMTKIDNIIDELIQTNIKLVEMKGRGAMGPLMGDLMKIVGRGAVDGNILSKKLMQALQPYVKQPSKKKGGK